MIKQIWNDPVWSKVIAVAIVALAGIAWASYRHWWSVIWLWMAKMHAYLGGTIPVRRWVYGLLLGVAALFVLLLIGAASTVYSAKKTGHTFAPIVPVEPWRSYVADIFYDIKWQWSYQHGEITRLCTFCPRCDYQMVPEGLDYIRHIWFRCDVCKRKYDVQEDWGTVQSIVTRCIQQKLRSDTYPKQQVVEGKNG
jgi:hypothetical protein